MDLQLRGRVAVVTGGASGIGRKTCHLYAEEGAKVVIFDVDADNGQRVAKECMERGGEALFVDGDVRSRDDCARMVQAVLERFGQLDILVHNAAPYTDGSAVKPLLKQELGVSQEMVDVILWGAINTSEAVLPHMFVREYGRLVFICSDAGREGDMYQPVYAASKAGIIGWAKSMARYGGRKNVLSNVVSPALTMTKENAEMLESAYGAGTEEGMKKLTKSYPTGRLAKATDIANMVVFLTSDRCGDVTGQVVGVDGGYIMPGS